MRKSLGVALLVALVLFIAYQAGIQAAPYGGCEACLAQGNSWWWCFSIYGAGCY